MEVKSNADVSLIVYCETEITGTDGSDRVEPSPAGTKHNPIIFVRVMYRSSRGPHQMFVASTAVCCQEKLRKEKIHPELHYIVLGEICGKDLKSDLIGAWKEHSLTCEQRLLI